MSEQRASPGPIEKPDGWYIEEGHLLGTRIAVVHRGDCKLCLQGMHPLEGDGRWLGPFASEQEAIRQVWLLPEVVMRFSCRCTGKNAPLKT